MTELTRKRLKELLNYDPEKGEFVWRISRRCVKKGDIAGNLRSDGYIRIMIHGIYYYAHKLAWLYFYGRFPINQIDHINHDRSDNSIYNLRDVTHYENGKNRTMHRNNKSGKTGIHWRKDVSEWRSYIQGNRKRIYLGYFKNIADAIEARKSAELKYNYHHNHGK